MGKNKSKKSKKAKNREPRKPIQIKKSTLKIIILSAILVAAVTAALIVRHVIKKKIADRIEEHIPKIRELMEQERQMESGEERKRDGKDKQSR